MQMLPPVGNPPNNTQNFNQFIANQAIALQMSNIAGGAISPPMTVEGKPVGNDL